MSDPPPLSIRVCASAIALYWICLSALATAVAAVAPSIVDFPRPPLANSAHDPAALARLKRKQSRARILPLHKLKRKRRVNLSLTIPLPPPFTAYRPSRCASRSLPASPFPFALHKSLPLTPESDAATSSAPSLYRSSTHTSVSTDFPPELFAPRPSTPSHLKRLASLAPSFKWQRRRLSKSSEKSIDDTKPPGPMIPWPLGRQKPKRSLTVPPNGPRPLDRHAVSLTFVSMVLEERRQAAL